MRQIRDWAPSPGPSAGPWQALGADPWRPAPTSHPPFQLASLEARPSSGLFPTFPPPAGLQRADDSSRFRGLPLPLSVVATALLLGYNSL